MADKKTKAAGEKKNAKKSGKPNFFERVGRYFRDTKGEWKRIVWPSKKTVINNTIVVLVVVAITAAVVWGLDAIFSLVRSLLISIL